MTDLQVLRSMLKKARRVLRGQRPLSDITGYKLACHLVDADCQECFIAQSSRNCFDENAGMKQINRILRESNFYPFSTIREAPAGVRTELTKAVEIYIGDLLEARRVCRS